MKNSNRWSFAILSGKEEETLAPILSRKSHRNAFIKLLSDELYLNTTVMLRKFCLEKTGLFDESLWSIEDRDLWLRITANFPIACLPGIRRKRRVHHFNISKEKELSLRGKIKVLEKIGSCFLRLPPQIFGEAKPADSYCKFGYLLLKNESTRFRLKSWNGEPETHRTPRI